MNWDQLLTQVVYPAVALLIPALIAVLIAYLNKHLGLQTAAAQDNTARVAVQGAVSTFAGKVLGDVETGKLSLAGVRAGAAGADMAAYAASTVGSSVARLAITPETLNTMLVGKVGTLVAPAVVAAAAGPPL